MNRVRTTSFCYAISCWRYAEKLTLVLRYAEHKAELSTVRGTCPTFISIILGSLKLDSL